MKAVARADTMNPPRRLMRAAIGIVTRFVRRSLLSSAVPLVALCGQGTPATLTPQFRTVWPDSAPQAQVVHTWQRYFESRDRDLAGRAGTPSALWVPGEQRKWPWYDLAGFYVPTGSVPHLVKIQEVAGSQQDVFEITVRFTKATVGAAADSGSTLLSATWTVERRDGAWLLANSLPRRTRRWDTEHVGQITYHVEPSLTFNRARALAAVQFIDSLADAFDVPRLDSLDYYVTPTVDAALAAIGVEYPTRFGPGGGFAKPVNRQLFAAVPAWGEDYRHELTHLVLLPLLQGKTITIVASEGIATWFGGTAGMRLRQAVGSLKAYLSLHPAATLDSAITPGALPQAETYAAGAVLCDMLHRHGGSAALRAFLLAGPGPAQIREALTRILGRSWNSISSDWRIAVDRIAAPA